MATATGKLINISPPHTVTSWCLSVRAPEIYSLSQFPVFSTVLFCFVLFLAAQHSMWNLSSPTRN